MLIYFNWIFDHGLSIMREIRFQLQCVVRTTDRDKKIFLRHGHNPFKFHGDGRFNIFNISVSRGAFDPTQITYRLFLWE